MKTAMIITFELLCFVLILVGCETLTKTLKPTAEFVAEHPELPALASAATGGSPLVYWVVGLASAGLVAIHELRKKFRKKDKDK